MATFLQNHRDLKPENIVLGDYGEAIVLDWGLAKQIGSADEETAPVVLTDDAQSQATKLGATPGTPAYMSPEQAAGRVDLLDQRTDIYGLGTILFEILTGHPPHRTVRLPASDPNAKTVIENVGQVSNLPASGQAGNLPHDTPRLSLHDLLQRISEAPTPRARDVDRTISRELDAICATAMSKKRDERYLDAKALAADVKRSLAHQPVSVYRTGAWERLRLWRRRNPAVAGLSATVVIVLLMGMAVSSFFAIQSAARNRDLLKFPCCPALTVKMQNQVAAALKSPYNELQRELATQPQVFMDESPTKQANQKAWLWTAVTKLFAVFAIFSSRKGDALPKLLGDSFHGIVNCDRAKMYWQAERLQWCWAHLKRDIQALIDHPDRQVKRLGHDLMRQVKLMFQHWRTYKAGDIDWSTCRALMSPIRETINGLLQRGAFSGNRRLVGMCQKLHNHREWLWTFVDHEGI